MEGHPIPQDITGFQFKIIGDMTIKQFAYVAFGSILAWILYSLPLPGIIKIPIAAFFALFGVGMAFVPIGGRPMDTMVYNFVKALFSPSQYIYQKTGGQIFAPASQTQQQPVGFIRKTEEPKNELDKKEKLFVSSVLTPTATIVQAGPRIITSNISGTQNPPIVKEEKPQETVAKSPEEKEQYLAQEEGILEKELQTVKTEEAAAVNTPNAAQLHQKVLELEKVLQETTVQRQELERQIVSLQQKLNMRSQKTYAPSDVIPKKATQNVRAVPQGMGKSVGVPIVPEFPNLLTGIVKDPRGNPLPNILVEVKDKEGNPVRAFKTNGLGQFASATALANGTYDIAFEDQRGQNKFDIIEINATGNIILPLEVISQDAREELRKSLFS